MRLQPPFPPFFLRGLGRCRRCGDGGGSRCGPGGVPRPSAFAAAGRLCRRGRSRVGGVFGAAVAADLFPAAFAALPEPCFGACPRVASAGREAVFPAGSMGVPGAGRVPRLRRGRDGREVARPRAAPDFAQTAASSRHCGRPSAPCCGPAAAQAAVRRPHPGRDAVRIWLRRSGPVSAPGCGRDAVRPSARVSAPGRPCAGHIPEPVPRWGS